VAQPGRHDLPDCVQRACRRFFDAGTSGDSDLECDGEGDGLLVVEQQRGQLRTSLKPVSAVGAFDGHYGVTELAQAVDIAAHGARADVQPFGQQRPRPVPARLEQREQRQQSR
jgi:hypothetical protein